MVEQTGGEPLCRHHWIIESPNGATSPGRCKICGEEKPFRNSNHDLDWKGYRTQSPEVAPDNSNQGAPVALTMSVLRTIDQLGGKKIA